MFLWADFIWLQFHLRDFDVSLFFQVSCLQTKSSHCDTDGLKDSPRTDVHKDTDDGHLKCPAGLVLKQRCTQNLFSSVMIVSTLLNKADLKHYQFKRNEMMKNKRKLHLKPVQVNKISLNIQLK